MSQPSKQSAGKSSLILSDEFVLGLTPQSEIAKAMGCSKQMVAKYEKKGLAKIRRHLEASGIEGYDDLLTKTATWNTRRAEDHAAIDAELGFVTSGAFLDMAISFDDID